MKNLYLKLDEEFKEFKIERFDRKDVIFNEEGIQYRIYFPNGFGASIVKHSGSYGYDRDLWELALLKIINEDKWVLSYQEIVGGDVLGYLTDKEVNKVLKFIKDGKVNKYINDLYEDFDERFKD